MKVFIVDSSPLVLARLNQIFSELPDVEIVGEAQNSMTAIRSLRALAPDVVVLDTRLSDGKSFSILQEIKETHLNTKVIAFAGFNYPQYQRICMDMGADYFCDKLTEIDKVMAILYQLRGENTNYDYDNRSNLQQI